MLAVDIKGYAEREDEAGPGVARFAVVEVDAAVLSNCARRWEDVVGCSDAVHGCKKFRDLKGCGKWS
jgi:hypothetical protein